jgi:hypothetical protein
LNFFASGATREYSRLFRHSAAARSSRRSRLFLADNCPDRLPRPAGKSQKDRRTDPASNLDTAQVESVHHFFAKSTGMSRSWRNVRWTDSDLDTTNHGGIFLATTSSDVRWAFQPKETTMMSRVHLCGGAMCLLLVASAPVQAATYYVSTTGSDSNAGTEAAPFATWEKAQTTAAPGDTVYFRGGRYVYTTAISACTGTSATVDSVVLSKSGTSGSPINYFAYPGEKPIFDFTGVTSMTSYNCRHVGVRVTGSWLHLKGLEFAGVLQLNNLNHESWCVYVYGGTNNVFEMLDAHHNMGPGFFIQRGGNNTFLNCDSHENEDTMTSNGDGQSADGFGCHPDQAGDTGNLFHGCRAWWNSDDAWDFIHASEACTVEYSWTWYQGYKPDALSGGAPVALSAGNGNGFKGGGYDMPPTRIPSPIPQHIIRFNVSFYNKASGFYANHSPDSAFFYNNTGFMNHPDFNMLGVGSDLSSSISVGFLRNNLAFGGTLTSDMNLGGLIDDQNNSWDTGMGLTVTDADFQSVTFAPPASCPAPYSPGGTVCVPPTDTTSFAGMASARQADGSLPILPFLRLAAGSKLIDKGTTTGLPQPYPAYVGAAPDLGAFEYGATTSAGGSSGATGGAVGTGGVAGGNGGTGGSIGAGTGGVNGGSGGALSGGTTGGTGGARTGGTTGGSGGAGNGGGAAGTGGAGLGGNTAGTGGARAGGTTGAGGGISSGGAIGTATGGASSTGGLFAAGGSIAQGGGSLGAGGSPGPGGQGAGGQTSTGSAGGGAAGSTTAGGSSNSGCSCAIGARSSGHPGFGVFAFLLGAATLRCLRRPLDRRHRANAANRRA